MKLCHTIANHKSTTLLLYCLVLHPRRLSKMHVVMYILAHNMQKHTCNETTPTPQLSEQELTVQLVVVSVLCLFILCCLEALRKHCPLTWLAWPEWNSMKDGAGMLLEKAGVRQHWRWEGLEMWRGRPFVGGVYLWENSQAAQAEVMSGLFSYSSTKKTVWLCLRALSLFY